jgi:diacylglycerol O-acyltransferase / wax synthase
VAVGVGGLHVEETGVEAGQLLHVLQSRAIPRRSDTSGDMAAPCTAGVRSATWVSGNVGPWFPETRAGGTVSELHYDEWMSESDSVLWHIERDPLLRSTITSVWFLDSVPDRERMDAVVARIVERIPRLHQRVVDEQPGVAPPRWADDPHVDIDYHYTWARLPGRRPGRRQVLDHAQRMGARAFDKDRPLWELCVVEGLPAKRAAFIMKVHHAIADGLGMVQLLQHMVDLEAEPERRSSGPTDTAATAAPVDHRLRVEAPVWAIPGARSLAHRIASEAKTGARIGRASLRTATDLLRDPRGTIEQLGRTTGSIARVVMPATTPLSPVMTDRSLNTHFEAVSVPFSALKAAARSVDGTLNDAFVAITLDALKRYHDAVGQPCSEIRMNMPISVRGGDAAHNFDNQFVPARMVLPLSGADPAQRIREVKELLRGARRAGAASRQRHLRGDLQIRPRGGGVDPRCHVERCRHHHVERARTTVPGVHGRIARRGVLCVRSVGRRCDQHHALQLRRCRAPRREQRPCGGRRPRRC